MDLTGYDSVDEARAAALSFARFVGTPQLVVTRYRPDRSAATTAHVLTPAQLDAARLNDAGSGWQHEVIFEATAGTNVEQWLRGMVRGGPPPQPGWAYANHLQMLLDLGRRWIAAPLPDGIERNDAPCYVAAWVLCGQRSDLTYVEGITMPDMVHHAWAVDGDGRVIDTTLDHPEDRAYWGLAFPDIQEVSRAITEVGSFGLIPNDFRRGDVLLRHGRLRRVGERPGPPTTIP